MSSTHEMRRQIRDFILQTFPLAHQRPLTDEDALLDGIVDSMGVLELANFVEAAFDITIAEEDFLLENFHSISALATFAQSKCSSDSVLQPEA